MADTSSDRSKMTIPAKEIPVTAEADVVVVGGGPAGFGAALRAARSGADTILIERFAIPGGNITTGFMPCAGRTPPLVGAHTELWERLEKEGYLYDITERYPNNQVYHAYPGYYGMYAFNPDLGACVMMEMMQEAGVRFLFRTLFVDAAIENNDTLDAVVVENASGRQAIRGHVFVDATGRGDVVARAGLPFKNPGDRLGRVIPCGLMWKMSGVHFKRLLDYQKNENDPRLQKAIEKARVNGDIPDDLYRPVPPGTYAGSYKGHPHLNCYPAGEPGELTVWQDAPYEWNLDCAANGEDATRAEIEIRSLIVAEAKFLKKYIPGFENAYVSGIAPFLGIREGRHPVGEHVLTYDDITNRRKFPDAALRRSCRDPFDFSEEPHVLEFEIPYRSFLAKGVNNLLLAGESVSFEHDVLFCGMRSFGPSIQTGEVAGKAAGLAVKQKIHPNTLQWAESPA